MRVSDSLLDITSVPPVVEVIVPVLVEGVKAGVLFVVHLFVGFVQEVVQFITAVVVAASWAWARFFTLSIEWIVFQCGVLSTSTTVSLRCWVTAVVVGDNRVFWTNNGWEI